jgi:membrane fusion protein, multidrug efflux system
VKWRLPSGFRKWLIVPPLLVGTAIVVLLLWFREQPVRAPVSEEKRVLRGIQVTGIDVVPTVVGYGTAQPGQVWRAVAEVQGRVVDVHPKLRAGTMIQAGEVLLRISAEEYELAVTRFKADIEEVEARLDETALRETNDRAALEIEEASLAVAERQLSRLQQLRERQAVAAAEVDQETRTVLTQRRNVQQLQNSLNLLPQQRRSLEATRAVKQAALTQAQLDLKKTVIRAPFAIRLSQFNIESGQFLSGGESIFEAHGTAFTEIEVQVPIDQLRNLIEAEYRVPLPGSMDPDEVRRLLDFDVTVRYRSGDFAAEWTGRVSRMREQLDPRTRTVGLVVAVDKPYEQVIPGKRPPLVRGMFCEVELRGAVHSAQVVIPRSAYHDGTVYVLDDDNRLRRRNVHVRFAQGDFLCLETGLREGEWLIVSDPTPVIEGLMVESITDERLQRRLILQAAGKGQPE